MSPGSKPAPARPASLPAARRRLLPDLIALLVAYLATGFGLLAYARGAFNAEASLALPDSGLLLLLLGILPLASLVILALRTQGLLRDIRRRSYGARLRARLSLLFLLGIGAATLPQGLFVVELGRQIQRAAAAAELQHGLNAGLELLQGYYDEDLARLERLALRELPPRLPARGLPDPEPLLGFLRSREPRIEAVEVFGPRGSVDFAGGAAARLERGSAPPISGALPASLGNSLGRLRYAVPAGEGSLVLTLRLPVNFAETTAALAVSAARAQRLARVAADWPKLAFLLYGIFILPLGLLALLFGLTAADLVAEPLAGLEDATRRVASGDLGLRLLAKPKDEIGLLLASFNRMLAEIERYREGDLRKGKLDAWKDIAQRLAHELKNPLTPIRLAAERLLRAYQKDPARAGEILEASMLAIVAEVEGMDALLQDFRSFASLPEPQRDWVELGGLVEESLALFRASYPDISFVVTPLPEGLILKVDRAQIKRVLGNLFLNALEAMDGQGRISLGADLVKTSESRYCRLRIDDTGKGIPRELGRSVFDPYFTTKEKGTGLGLAIALRIVEDHGGSLRYESEEGVGTTFYLDLPLDR